MPSESNSYPIAYASSATFYLGGSCKSLFLWELYMSVLANNVRLIRKELRCTQSAMAEILKIGFRTYVRYEAGERDAPVSVLIKLARLGIFR